MARAYIVMKKDWEYTDEYYYPSGGGHASSAYLDKAKASAACVKANREAARGKGGVISLGESFGEDCSHELSKVDAEILEKMNLTDLNEVWNYEVPADVTDDVLDKFLEQSGITFFVVSEVTLHG